LPGFVGVGNLTASIDVRAHAVLSNGCRVGPADLPNWAQVRSDCPAARRPRLPLCGRQDL